MTAGQRECVKQDVNRDNLLRVTKVGASAGGPRRPPIPLRYSLGYSIMSVDMDEQR